MSWQWWKQVGIDLEGANKRAAEAATDSELESGSDSDSGSGREELIGAIGSSGAEWSGAE